MSKSQINIFERWNLRSSKCLTKTNTSEIYSVLRGEEKLILKVLTKIGMESEGGSSMALKAYGGHGATQLKDHYENYILLEYLEGSSLSELVKKGEDIEATQIIFEVLERLHSAKIPDEMLPFDLNNRFDSLRQRAKLEFKESLLYRAFDVAEELISTEGPRVLLHGDIHHNNILKSTSRGWLAIDPQPLVGERLYDFANCFFNPDDCPSIVENIERIERMAESFAKTTGADPQRILKFAFAHGGLSVSWQLDEGQSPARRMRIMKCLASVLKL